MRARGPVGDGAANRVDFNALWVSATADLAILVPTYRHDPVPLIRELAECRASDRVELIVHDDGSADPSLTQAIIEALNSFPGPACLSTAQANGGRAHARNELEAISRATWLLYLDADMLPDSGTFLQTYLDFIGDHPEPSVIVGGMSLKRATWRSETDLHHAQCATSECVPVDRRRSNPGQYVFSSNVVVHREVMARMRFDTAFEGWGWEDVDWGIRTSRHYPIHHLDNPASHLGLDDSRTLLGKYTQSAANFLRVAEAHPQEMGRTALFCYASRLSRYPGLPVLRAIWRSIALAPRWLVPVTIRLKALKLYRATTYGDHIRHARRNR